MTDQIGLIRPPHLYLLPASALCLLAPKVRCYITTPASGRFLWNALDDTNSRLGIGTSSPYATLSVVGPVVAEYFYATSTNATSTFNGVLAITGLSGNIITTPSVRTSIEELDTRFITSKTTPKSQLVFPIALTQL